MADSGKTASCKMTFAELLDFREGKLDATTQERVRTHLGTGCASCAGRLTQIDRLLTALPEATEVIVPTVVRERVRDLFRERYPRPVPVRRGPVLSAQLLFGGLGQAGMLGARDASISSRTLQFLYGTDAYQIGLWGEQEEPGMWYLIGQVTTIEDSRPAIVTAVTLIAQDQDAMGPRTATTESGEFHLPGVANGMYILQIEVDKQTVEIVNIEVGS